MKEEEEGGEWEEEEEEGGTKELNSVPKHVTCSVTHHDMTEQFFWKS